MSKITPARSSTAGLVLAGGQSTRMGGQNKALMFYKGSSLLSLACANLEQQTAQVYISSGPHHYNSAHPQISDSGQQGPLEGICQGLKRARDDGFSWLLSIPCDTPNAPKKWAEALFLNGVPSYVTAGTRDHYAHALWSIEGLPIIEAELKAGQRSLRGALSALGANPIDLTDITSSKAFANINHLSDVITLKSE